MAPRSSISQQTYQSSELEEPEEPYSLTYELILNDEVVQTAFLEKVIEANTRQTTSAKAEGEEPKIGETIIEGEAFPRKPPIERQGNCSERDFKRYSRYLSFKLASNPIFPEGWARRRF